MRYHYNRQDLIMALQKIGVERGSVVFTHSNVGFLGIPEGGNTIQNACNTILDAFFDVIGAEGTLIVPTFTYSFSEGKPYDPNHTVSNCGIFSENIRQHSMSVRSNDPCISVAALGARAREMTYNTAENAYAEHSFFDRFYKANGVICNINFDAGSTFVHYVERKLQVPYRFDKTFMGTIIDNCGEIKQCISTIWVRHMQPGTEAQFETFNALAVESNLYKKARVGRGFIGCISAVDTFNLIRDTIFARPWFLTKAEHLGIEPVGYS